MTAPPAPPRASTWRRYTVTVTLARGYAMGYGNLTAAQAWRRRRAARLLSLPVRVDRRELPGYGRPLLRCLAGLVAR